MKTDGVRELAQQVVDHPYASDGSRAHAQELIEALDEGQPINREEEAGALAALRSILASADRIGATRKGLQ